MCQANARCETSRCVLAAADISTSSVIRRDRQRDRQEGQTSIKDDIKEKERHNVNTSALGQREEKGMHSFGF